MRFKRNHSSVKKAVCFFLLLFACATAISAPPKPGTTTPPPVLIVGLDGISFSVFQKMQEGGYFRNFKDPAYMVSTFPSISDPSWAFILHTKAEKSYSKAYFDMRTQTRAGIGVEKGGLINHLMGGLDYEKKYDFKPEGFFEKTATTAWIETTALYWLEALEKAFFTSKNKKSKY